MHETPETPAEAQRRRARPPRPQQALLTLSQGRYETGIPENTLRDLIARGHLPAVRLPDSRRIWVRRVDLATIIERSVERVSA